MSRLSSHSIRVNVALGALLLGLVTAVSACEEESKTAPERCLDPKLPLFDIQTAGARDDIYPCNTSVGHSVSSIGNPTTAGTTSGGTATGGKGGSGGTATGGKGGSGGTATADAGAGGAGGAGGAP